MSEFLELRQLCQLLESSRPHRIWHQRLRRHQWQPQEKRIYCYINLTPVSHRQLHCVQHQLNLLGNSTVPHLEVELEETLDIARYNY